MMYRPESDPYVLDRMHLLDPHDIYLAGPFFTEQQLSQNKWLTDVCQRAGFRVFVPARDCRYKPGDPQLAADRAFWLNRYHIDKCKFVLADLCWPDSGTAWELGYADAIGRARLGIVGDRKSAMNLMLRNTVMGLLHIGDLNQAIRVIALDIKDRGKSPSGVISKIGFSAWDGRQE